MRGKGERIMGEEEREREIERERGGGTFPCSRQPSHCCPNSK